MRSTTPRTEFTCRVYDLSSCQGIVAVFDSAEAADTVSESIGSPWLREHVIPRLSSPTEQYVGEAIYSLGF
jgi:hypothetical protein